MTLFHIFSNLVSKQLGCIFCICILCIFGPKGAIQIHHYYYCYYFMYDNPRHRR